MASGDGSLFPLPPFNAVVCPAGAAPKASNAEIVRVTGIAGDVLTIARGPQAGDPGGINRTIVAGDQVFSAITRKTLVDAEPVYSQLQNGVILATDAVLSSPAISSAALITGTLSAANPLWVMSAAGVLLPVAFAGASLSFTPATKPATTQYRGYGIEIDSTGTVSLATGSADCASVALALANINTVPAAGKLRVADIVMLNTSGTYSLPALATRDRRAWARGALSKQLGSSSNYTTASTTYVLLDATNLSARIECSGTLIRLKLVIPYIYNSTLNVTYISFAQDGVGIDGMAGLGATCGTNCAWWGGLNANTGIGATVEWVAAPAPGSHLFQPMWGVAGGAATMVCGAAQHLLLAVEEVVRATANNGTA